MDAYLIPGVVLAIAVAVLVVAAMLHRRAAHRARAVVFTRSWPALGRDAIAQQLAGWSESDPHWRALWDLYGEEFQAVLLELYSLPETREAMLTWKGRMMMVLHMRSQLLNLRGAQQRTE